MLARHRRPPLRAQQLGDSLSPGIFFSDAWTSVQGQAKQEAGAYKQDLLQLAKNSAKEKMGPETSAIVSLLIDAVSDGQFTSKELVSVLSTAATVGVTAGCSALTSFALTPVCAVAGGIAGKLVGNLLSSGSGKTSPDIPYRDLQVQKLRAEKKQVYAALLDQVKDEQLRDKVYKLVEAFYDERVLYVSNLQEGAKKRGVYVGDEYEQGSYFWDSEFGGGFFSVFASFYQVLPWELGKLTPKNDSPVDMSIFLPGDKPKKTPRDLLKECRFSNDGACYQLDGTFYQQDAERVARRREWFDALWAFLVSKGFPLTATDRKTWFPDIVLANPESLQINLQMVTYPYLKAKFESITGAIIAADIAIRQKPMLESLGNVTESMKATFEIKCESASCKQIVSTQARKLSKELVLYASKGPNPVQMQEAIKDAEDLIVSFLKIGSAVEDVEKAQANQKKAASRNRWLLTIGILAAAGAGYKYRRKLGFK